MDRPSDQRFLAGVRRLVLQRYTSDPIQGRGAMGRTAGIAAVLDLAALDFHLDRDLPEPPAQSRDHSLGPYRAGRGRDLLSRDAEFRHAPVRSAGDRAARWLRPQPAAAELLDGDPSAVALHRLRQRRGAVRVRVRRARSRASSTTDGFAPRGAGRSSRGSFSRSATCSARAGRTRSWDGAATGRGTRSRTRPSCRGW